MTIENNDIDIDSGFFREKLAEVRAIYILSRRYRVRKRFAYPNKKES